ncbi:hypothetical protein AX16_001582 [Volvariella volvacea WC 439]|nr:hypothetical protein AX16_001582 [Volvariella volvacea WC 439]
MKRFLAKASNLKPYLPQLPAKVVPSSNASTVDVTATLSANSHHPNGHSAPDGQAGYHPPAGSTIGIHGGHVLPPRLTVPPVPHPCPHDHLELLAHQDGLLMRPHIVPVESGLDDSTSTVDPSSYVRIAWGKNGKVEEVEGKLGSDGQEIEWDSSVVVYGIVGMVELFSGSYLLVISSRSEVGYLFDPSRVIYGVKGVTSIPLDEEHAQIALNTLASRNAGLARPSLLQQPRSSIDTGSDSPTDQDTVRDLVVTDSPVPSLNASPRVQFAAEHDVKLMTPVTTQSFGINTGEDDVLRVPLSRRSSSSDISGISTPSSENSFTTSPVAKTIASKLSFWSRLSQRPGAQDIPAPIAKDGDAQVSGQQEQTPATSPGQHEIEKVIDERATEPTEALKKILSATAPPPETAAEKRSELEDKVLKECVKEFTRGGMYFSYTFDITRSLQHKEELVTTQQHNAKGDANSKANSVPVQHTEGGHADPLAEPSNTLPLWRRVDKQYWWNEWISRPFADAGLHPYVLPIMQGYFQISGFNMPSDPATHDEDIPVQYIIISRRSRDRAGLRYQRRGIDEDAHVANFVETETIMRVYRLGVDNIFSYVQIRGSIPLFWTQSSNGLKPPPVLAADRTKAQNLDALRRHFQITLPQYGPHTVVNLAEQHGKEGPITQGYRDYIAEAGLKDVQYCEYDFHVETRGMKYENIQKLIDKLDRVFETQGYLWISNNTILSRQRGVYRVNCIDCLDRTNVVQSAFARYILNKQLGAVALLNPDAEGRTETDIVVNDLWANNGDAISRAYAGTSALKGDFTRTGKRDLSGLLNDGMNSLARMYTATFSDWFCQAVIDFLLGNRNLSVFSEFLNKLQSSDPRDLIRLSKIRAEAIATSVSRVLVEGESLLHGWTLFAPEEFNARIGDKFEEKVLLLTSKALYIVSYDYTLEKVKAYTRILLGDIIGISKGAYILSPLEEASRDPSQNAGFVITWHSSRQVTRVTSYSVRNSVDASTISTAKSMVAAISSSPPPTASSTTLSSSPPSSSVLSTPLPPPTPTPSTSTVKASKAPPTPARRTSAAAAAIMAHKATITDATRRSFQNLSRRSSVMLSSYLNNAAKLVASTDKVYAAFKVLPLDPAAISKARSGAGAGRSQSPAPPGEGSGEGKGGGAEVVEEALEAKTCREAADLIVESIRKACEDAGNGGPEFVLEEDVVSLADAQKMTSVYAKMEYGVKRLLWLGG